jgi:xylan 1,4-beta-xylosidase
MTIQGIKKPAYYAYKFLNELGKNELLNGDRDSWVCTNGNNDVEALFWNITILDQKTIPNPVFYRMDLLPTETYKTMLQIANVPAGKYIREIYRIGYKQNDAFTAYYEMGLPDQLNREQVKILKSMSDGSPVSREIVEVTEKGYKESFEVRTNDVFFVKLKKIN